MNRLAREEAEPYRYAFFRAAKLINLEKQFYKVLGFVWDNDEIIGDSNARSGLDRAALDAVGGEVLSFYTVATMARALLEESNKPEAESLLPYREMEKYFGSQCCKVLHDAQRRLTVHGAKLLLLCFGYCTLGEIVHEGQDENNERHALRPPRLGNESKK